MLPLRTNLFLEARKITRRLRESHRLAPSVFPLILSTHNFLDFHYKEV